MRKMRKIFVVLTLLLVSGFAVGAIFTYYAKIDSDVEILPTFQIKDNKGGTYGTYQNAEDYVISDPITDVGGFTKTFDFTIKLSNSASGQKTIYFTVTDFEDDGVDVVITRTSTGVEVSSFVFEAGEEIEFTYTLTVDEYTPASTYNCDVLISA